MPMMRADISKAMYVGAKEIFKKTLKRNRAEEWKAICSIKKSDGMEEKYETIGNLKPAAIKAEGDPMVYGKIIDGHTTTVTNVTVTNGFEVTMEAKADERWGIVPLGKVEELARTMNQYKERSVAAVWDNVLVSVGADGVPLASHIHPLIDNAVLKNDNLIENVFNTDSYTLAVNMFNDWKNHQGEMFDTLPTSILAHRNRMTEILAMLQSQLVAFENSNTKNTIEKLKPIFNRYISKLMVHIIDESIDSVILQKRQEIETNYDYDKRSTFNWYFNVFERYKADCINPGFGFITIKGAL